MRPLPTLREGERVMVKLDNQNMWNDTGTIKRFDPDRRTCIIETPLVTVRRNWRHVKLATSKSTRNPCVPNTADPTNTLLENFNIGPPVEANVKKPLKPSEPITPQPRKPTTVTRSGRTIIRPARYGDFVPQTIVLQMYFVILL